MRIQKYLNFWVHFGDLFFFYSGYTISGEAFLLILTIFTGLPTLLQ